LAPRSRSPSTRLLFQWPPTLSTRTNYNHVNSFSRFSISILLFSGSSSFFQLHVYFCTTSIGIPQDQTPFHNLLYSLSRVSTLMELIPPIPMCGIVTLHQTLLDFPSLRVPAGTPPPFRFSNHAFFRHAIAAFLPYIPSLPLSLLVGFSLPWNDSWLSGRSGNVLSELSSSAVWSSQTPSPFCSYLFIFCSVSPQFPSFGMRFCLQGRLTCKLSLSAKMPPPRSRCTFFSVSLFHLLRVVLSSLPTLGWTLWPVAPRPDLQCTPASSPSFTRGRI